MHKTIYILLFVFFFKPIFPFLEYVLNYNYIVAELCENKSKPQLKCNGKCYLAKQLAKNVSTESDTSSDKKTNTLKNDIEIFNEYEELAFIFNGFLTQNSINDYYSNLYFHSNNSDLFRPPIAYIS